MTVRIYFIIPALCKSEKDCSAIMQETYNAVVLNNIFATWLKESETNMEMIETGKTDFVIFEKFEGELYKKVLRSKSVRILAPLCLLQCIKEGKPIPNSETPLVSVAMENCIVVCSCLPKESKRDLKFKVQAMAGLFSLQLLSNTTHLITNGVKSEKYNMAVEMGIKIMCVEFIDSLWEASKTRITHAYDDDYLMYKCPVFLNLNFSITGFAKHDTQVQKLIEEHGGNFSSSMDVHKTDILICKSSNSTSSQKYKSAMKNKIDCTTPEWLFDSVEKGYALPNIADYAVKAATSTPTKRDAFVDPNFSQMSMIIKPTSSLQSEFVMPSVIEQTMDQSYLLGACAAAPDRNSTLANDQVIDNIDIKKVKASGPFLDGCVVFAAGFKPESKEKLCKILNFSGAVSCLALNDRITHAIIGDIKCNEFKQIAIKNLPCAVVSIPWLLDSMNQRMPADVDKYLLHCDNANLQSPTEGTSSPLSKKGLSFLRANINETIADVTIADKIAKPPAAHNDQEQEDDVLRHYRNSMQGKNSVDDALAAFSLNVPTSEEGSNVLSNSADASKSSTSNLSISITVEESVVAVFANLTFAVIHYTEVEKDYIVEQIKEMQGTVVGAGYEGVVDYAIVPINSQTSQTLPFTASKTVTYLWVSECAEKKRLITECEYYHLPFGKTLNVLNGMCISISGYSNREKEFLAHVITQFGGVEQDCMARRSNPEKNTLATTHLICNEPSGKKYQGALKWGLPVVSMDWLFKCAAEERHVEEHLYLIGDSKASCGFQPPSTVTTPFRKRIIDEVNVCTTPPGMVLPSCSQITPVNEIMARVRKMCGDLEAESSPCTPVGKHLDQSMATPDTPYGACFQDPPPPELRKKWKRWLDNFPTPVKDPSTPLSEIRRQYLAMFKTGDSSPIAGRQLYKDFVSSEAKKILAQHAQRQENVPMELDNPYNDTENAMNDLVIAQFNELESHMMSSGGSAKRQSIRKMEREGGVIPERESQPMSVGWDDNMVIPMTVQVKPKNFMLSGLDTDERVSVVEKLEQLGATVSALSNFDPSSTHLLCEKFSRNEKLLASLASGLWILHISYASDSAAAGRLLNEEDYEFGNQRAMHKFKLDSDSLQKASAARYWREEIARRGYGAFHDVRAIVHANKKEPMIRVLQAGGAVIVEASAPFGENVSATHCFLDVKNIDLTQYIPLAQQGILCVNTLYVNDFLQKSAQNINDFIVPGFQNYY